MDLFILEESLVGRVLRVWKIQNRVKMRNQVPLVLEEGLGMVRRGLRNAAETQWGKLDLIKGKFHAPAP